MLDILWIRAQSHIEKGNGCEHFGCMVCVSQVELHAGQKKKIAMDYTVIRNKV